MKTARIVVREEAVGTVRTGFTGAHAELIKTNRGFAVKFFNSSRALSLTIPVKEGHEYIIGPNWLKKLPTIHNDRYWPRRWAREFGKVAHMSYFVLMSPGQEYEAENLGHTATLGCPEKLHRASFKPLNGFGFGKCLVNREWLATTTYEEFCFRMAEVDRHNQFLTYCYDYANTVIQQYNALKPTAAQYLSIKVAGQEIRAAYRKDGRLCLAYRTKNVRKNISVWTIEGAGVTQSTPAYQILGREMSQAARKLFVDKTVEEVKSTVSWSITDSDEVNNN